MRATILAVSIAICFSLSLSACCTALRAIADIDCVIVNSKTTQSPENQFGYKPSMRPIDRDLDSFEIMDR